MRAFVACLAALGLFAAGPAWATSVPRLSFEELTDRSEVIVQGDITQKWTNWDAGHKQIWTHYELSVTRALKGNPGASVTISEPGGVLGELGMRIPGTPVYTVDDHVLVFLARMPNGLLRTTGWGQGQYRVDASGILHASESLRAIELLPRNQGSSVTIESLTGRGASEIASRIKGRLAKQLGGVR